MRLALIVVGLVSWSVAQAAPPAPAQSPHADALWERAAARTREIAGQLDGVLAVSVRDLRDGRSFALRGSIDVPAASTIKIAILLALHQQAERGALSLAAPVTLRKGSMAGDDGLLSHLGDGTTTMSVGDLAAAMILLSENSATNLLLDRLGLPVVNDTLRTAGLTRTVLRRRMLDTTSPTTQLPGSAAIEREVQRRITDKQPFAFCYLDLDNLKAFNDFYGFAKADGVVRQTADILREVVAQLGTGQEFVGHVAGDDFVFLVAPDQVDTICQRIIEGFDRIIPLYYERTDRERGYIEADDRYGHRRRFPIMSVSIAAVMTDGSVDHPELARQAAELKKKAKAVAGSVVLRSDKSPTGAMSA